MDLGKFSSLKKQIINALDGHEQNFLGILAILLGVDYGDTMQQIF